MNINKIIEELEERARMKRKNAVDNAQATFDGYQQACNDIGSQVDKLVCELQWNPTDLRLPPEPINALEKTGHIDWDKVVECIVTIEGSSEATSLYYLGDDQWTDHEGRLYQVIAWMPLPEPYKPQNLAYADNGTAQPGLQSAT